MLSIKAIGNPEYYLNKARPKRRRRGKRDGDNDPSASDDADDVPMVVADPDYYFQPGQPPGQWLGNGCKALGLEGIVLESQLRPLFAGLSPDGERQLVKNAGTTRHRPAWDLTFSAPKSVSVLWSQSNAEDRRAIEEAVDLAIADTMELLEEKALFTRLGKSGHTWLKSGLVGACFRHNTSRELQPALHGHAVILNVGVRADGTTGAIHSPPIFDHKMMLGAFFRLSLEHRLNELGYATEPDRIGFRMVGVPDDLCDEQSLRRRQIEEALKSAGVSSAKAAAIAAIATRKWKGPSPPEAELIAAWREVNRRFGFDDAALEKLKGRHVPPRDPSVELSAAIRDAISQLLASQAHFSEQELLRAVFDAARGRGISPRRVMRTVRALIQSDLLVHLSPKARFPRYTTPEMLKIEKDMLAVIESLQDDSSLVLPQRPVQRFLDRRLPLKGKNLSEDHIKRNQEQRRAIEYLTTSPGKIQFVSGLAGTGKTYVLGCCRKLWEAQGLRVVGMALAGVAKENLAQDSGIASETLALRLRQLVWKGDFLRHHKRQLKRLLGGKRTKLYRPSFRLDSKTVVVLDEAGMVGTRDLAALVEHVRRTGAKLVLVGDRKQLQSIEAGGLLSAIEDRIAFVSLEHITRQELDHEDADPSWPRRMVKCFSKGNAAEALQLLQAHGRIEVADDREQAMQALLRDWAEVGLREPHRNLVLASTRAEVRQLNYMCQDLHRAVTSVPSGKSLHFKSLDGHGYSDAIDVYLGDLVIFTKNSRMFGVVNGDCGDIVALNRVTRTLTVRLKKNQRKVVIPLRDFPYLNLGYALTAHRAQGSTVDGVFALVGGKMQDQHSAYVVASRAKGPTRFYVDQSEAGEGLKDLVAQMSRNREKTLAISVMEEAAKAAPAQADATPSHVPQKPLEERLRNVQEALAAARAQRESASKDHSIPENAKASNAEANRGVTTPMGGAHEVTQVSSVNADVEVTPTREGADTADHGRIEATFTQDLKYLRATLDRYGAIPGGIVVEGTAASDCAISAMALDLARPGHIKINGTLSYRTHLDLEELALLWDAVYGASSPSDNLGALSHSTVVGIAPDCVIAQTLMEADALLGKFSYGYGPQLDLYTPAYDGYVNPFVAEVDALTTRDPDHLARVATAYVEGVEPRVFASFAHAQVRMSRSGGVVVDAKVNGALAAFVNGNQLCPDAAKWSPFIAASFQHVLAHFDMYCRRESLFARMSAIAKTTMFLRFARMHNVTFGSQDASVLKAKLCDRRRCVLPVPEYSTRLPGVAEKAAEVVRAIRPLEPWPATCDRQDVLKAVVEFDYAIKAADAELVWWARARLKKLIAEGMLRSAFPECSAETVARMRSHVIECMHDPVLVNCIRLLKSSDKDSTSAPELRQHVLPLMEPATEGPFAHGPTLCERALLMDYDEHFSDAVALLVRALQTEPESLKPFFVMNKIVWDVRYGRMTTSSPETLHKHALAILEKLGVRRLPFHLRQCLVEWLSDGGPTFERYLILSNIWSWEANLGDFAAALLHSNMNGAEARLLIAQRMRHKSESARMAFLSENNPFARGYLLLDHLSEGRLDELRRRFEEQMQVATACPEARTWWADEQRRRRDEDVRLPLLYAAHVVYEGATLMDVWKLRNKCLRQNDAANAQSLNGGSNLPDLRAPDAGRQDNLSLESVRRQRPNDETISSWQKRADARKERHLVMRRIYQASICELEAQAGVANLSSEETAAWHFVKAGLASLAAPQVIVDVLFCLSEWHCSLAEYLKQYIDWGGDVRRALSYTAFSKLRNGHRYKFDLLFASQGNVMRAAVSEDGSASAIGEWMSEQERAVIPRSTAKWARRWWARYKNGASPASLVSKWAHFRAKREARAKRPGLHMPIMSLPAKREQVPCLLLGELCLQKVNIEELLQAMKNGCTSNPQAALFLLKR